MSLSLGFSICMRKGQDLMFPQDSVHSGLLTLVQSSQGWERSWRSCGLTFPSEQLGKRRLIMGPSELVMELEHGSPAAHSSPEILAVLWMPASYFTPSCLALTSLATAPGCQLHWPLQAPVRPPRLGVCLEAWDGVLPFLPGQEVGLHVIPAQCGGHVHM